MIDLKTLMKSALVGVVLVAAPLAANAITIRLTDNLNGGGTMTIADASGADTIPGAFGVGFFGAFGGFSLTIATGTNALFPPFDELFANLTAGLLTGFAAGDITLEVSHVFDNTATTPGTVGSQLSQDLNTLTGAGTVTSYYGSGLFDTTGTLINSIVSSLSTNSALVNGSFNINSYSITHVINLSTASGTLQGSADWVAPVPIPAAGLLLLTALGGLGVAGRRRRKAA